MYFYFSIYGRVNKDTLPAPPVCPSGDEEASSSKETKVDLSGTAVAVVCGQGGNYFDVRAHLEDDGGFSAFCRLVERYGVKMVR